jgi:nitronate monooxygenase
MILPELKIGNITAKLPLIQGGMGIGVSLSNLASAVANEGGIGIISGVQIGFREPDFGINPIEANLRAIRSEIRKAREKSKGIIGMNFMAAMNNYELYVKEAVKEKIDIIISGAGLPLALPKLVKDSNTKIAPIVSSAKAAKVIIKSWLKHNRLPDAIVVEGPLAGGHLGFKYNELIENTCKTLKEITIEVIDTVKSFEEQFKVKIPIISAGGIRNKEDMEELFEVGAQGVQIASLFVPTFECDAHDNFKAAYVNATKQDELLITSPVGMPARAIKNNFIINSLSEKCKITKCYKCLPNCNAATIPYCISLGLIDAVQGRDGLVFSGANIGDINKIYTVKEVINKLFY